jgi:hypothetical protein
MKLSSVAAVAAMTAVSIASGKVVISPTPLWSYNTDSGVDWFANDSLARSLTYNPATGNVIVQSRTGANKAVILNGLTGAEVGRLNMSGITGGTLTYNTITATPDGAIYATNLVLGGGAFKVYRWASETAGRVDQGNTPPTVVFNGTINATDRFGDNVDSRIIGGVPNILVNGNGISTTLISINDTSGTTGNTSQVITTDAVTGDLRLGSAFVDDDTYLSKAPSRPLRRLDISGTTATTSLSVNTLLGSTSAVGYDAQNGVVGLVHYGIGAPGPVVQLYPINNFSAAANGAFVAPSGGFAANGNGTGAVDFNNNHPIGGIVYALSSNQGVVAYEYLRLIKGDINFDGSINNQDIAPFVAALTGTPTANEEWVGDVDDDGVFNNQDIAPFVALLTGSRPLADLLGDPEFAPLVALVPEPASLSLLGLGGLALLTRRRV